MITEGIGRKSPQQVQISMTQNEQFVVLDISKKRAEHRAYRSRRDQWGQGIKDGITIPIGQLSRDLRPIYCGCLGEYAVQRHLECRFPGRVEIDWRLTKYGDFGVDLTCFGLRMQIKTRQAHARTNLFRRTNNRGRIVPVYSHVCCFCEWNLMSQIYILGWCWRDSLVAKPLVDGVGEWKNVEITDDELLPMNRLRDELETWRGAQRCR